MIKLSHVWLIMVLLLGACSTPMVAPLLSSPPALPKSNFSHFSSVRLTPTVLPGSMGKVTVNKKSAAQLDRELVIRLSKNLKNQKIAPTNDNRVTARLNIIPVFKVQGASLILEVRFQDNITGAQIAQQAFTVNNNWRNGFKNSSADRLLLAELAQQVVEYIVRSQ